MAPQEGAGVPPATGTAEPAPSPETTKRRPNRTDEALEAAIRTHHPYELPEIVAVPVERGLPAYLDWVAAETARKP